MKPKFHKLQDIGCICCRTLGYVQPADMHHPLIGGRRIHDNIVIPLCEWHHRGVFHLRFKSKFLAATLLGPSLALNPKAFRELFGDDQALLAKANELLEAT